MHTVLKILITRKDAERRQEEVRGRVNTYKAPRAKTNISAAFWLTGIRERYNIGIGNTRMMTSVAMLNPAFAYQFFGMDMQVPGIDLFQARGTGVHWKTEAKKVATM